MTNDPKLVNYQKEIGNRIKRFRQSLHLTQKQLAEKMGGNSQGMISQVENGVKFLSLRSIGDFAHALNVSIEDILAPNHTSYLPINDSASTQQQLFGYYLQQVSDSWGIASFSIRLLDIISDNVQTANLYIEDTSAIGLMIELNNHIFCVFRDAQLGTGYTLISSREYNSKLSLYHNLWGLNILLVQSHTDNTIAQRCLLSPYSLNEDTLAQIFSDVAYDPSTGVGLLPAPYSYLNISKSRNREILALIHEMYQ